MPKKRILFLISHQPNPRIIKQLNFFSKYFSVTVIHFTRQNLADLNKSINSKIKLISLPHIPDSKVFTRLIIYMKTILKLRKALKGMMFELIMVNNIDTLFLYYFLGKRRKTTKIIMQISDLRKYISETSFKSLVLKSIDHFIYSRLVNLLILTSERFYSEYYKNVFKGQYFILENKPLEESLPKRKHKNIVGSKVRIGIVGLLLREKEYKVLFEEFGGDSLVEIYIFGKGPFQDQIEAAAEKYSNISYFGPYNFFTDAAQIYSKIDLLFAIYSSSYLNNRVALPNKLYEAMYFKTPIIVSSETYLSERVLSLQIGYACQYDDRKSLRQIVTNLKDSYHAFQTSFNSLDEIHYIGDIDYNNLYKLLVKL